jgi:hypothetical protein
MVEFEATRRSQLDIVTLPEQSDTAQIDAPNLEREDFGQKEPSENCLLTLGNGSRSQRRLWSTKGAARASLNQAEVVDRVSLFGSFQGRGQRRLL